MSPLLAQSRHELLHRTCPVSGGKADITICGMSAFAVASGVKRTCRFALHMSAFDAVDGAPSAASKCYRVVALKRARLKEVRPGTETAFEVLKELARTRRRNAETVVPGIGRTRLGQRTLKCVFLIGTRSAQSIRASGLIRRTNRPDT